MCTIRKKKKNTWAYYFDKMKKIIFIILILFPFTSFAQTDSTANDTCQIIVPNAISPNSEPPVDKLIIYYNCVFSDFEFTIYNRWGTKIYETNSLNNDNSVNWKYQLVEEGTYFWVLKCTIQEKEFSGTGYITLVK